jgi:hypothetical protein
LSVDLPSSDFALLEARSDLLSELPSLGLVFAAVLSAGSERAAVVELVSSFDDVESDELVSRRELVVLPDEAELLERCDDELCALDGCEG